MAAYGSPVETRSAYLYAIVVDGIVRYVGKGRNGRIYTHLIEARRSVSRRGARTPTGPRMRRRLTEAVRSGADIQETIILGGLTDQQAYRLESLLIAEFHKFRTDQLWNTIDERFMDRRWLPEKWDDPENLLYRLPRPLASKPISPAAGPYATLMRRRYWSCAGLESTSDGHKTAGERLSLPRSVCADHEPAVALQAFEQDGRLQVNAHSKLRASPHSDRRA